MDKLIIDWKEIELSKETVNNLKKELGLKDNEVLFPDWKEIYFYIEWQWDINREKSVDDGTKMWNYFKTEEEAQAYKEMRMYIIELQSKYGKIKEWEKFFWLDWDGDYVVAKSFWTQYINRSQFENWTILHWEVEYSEMRKINKLIANYLDLSCKS